MSLVTTEPAPILAWGGSVFGLAIVPILAHAIFLGRGHRQVQSRRASKPSKRDQAKVTIADVPSATTRPITPIR